MNLDQFQNLERVGNTIYLGFNDGIERVVFPKLKEIAGALVVESNAQVKELVFPALTSVARYVHIHENRLLEKLELPKLATVGAELSILDNGKLVHVVVASKAAPAGAAALEVARNAAPAYAGLCVRVLPHA